MITENQFKSFLYDIKNTENRKAKFLPGKPLRFLLEYVAENIDYIITLHGKSDRTKKVRITKIFCNEDYCTQIILTSDYTEFVDCVNKILKEDG
jgi:hypothetical protein